VLPALVALTAGNFEGKARVAAYGVLGGVAGAGIAVGPILGGWVTTNLTWRLVFAGEVVLVLAILLGTRMLKEPPAERQAGGLDWVGSILSALGLALVVFAVLQSSNWGWLQPRNSPITPLGFSLVPFMIAAGVVVLGAFRSWERHREASGLAPLVRFELLRIPTLRSGLGMFVAQNAILLGIFFTVPLYLQVVQGYDAFKTGVQMLPVSIAMLVTAMGASRLASRWSARTIVRAGLVMLLVATAILIGTIDPKINTTSFAVAMAAIGIGMGLIVSQLGNVAQSAVTDADRREAGGLQFTAQQFGAALGTALIGAVLITGLISSFSSNISSDPRISADVNQQVGVRLQGQVSFVSTDQVRTAAEDAGIDPATTDALVSNYADAQLRALKTALLAAGFIVLASFFTTGALPSRPFDASPGAADPSDVAAAASAGS
jgi:MFS family permease